MNETPNLIKPKHILLVEDNPIDVLVTKEALMASSSNNNIYTVSDGVEALEFLYRSGKFSSAPKPDLIFLDLNLPKKDGREVLLDIKADPVLKRIPVIILTTSKADEDINRSYDLHANCFITKPVDLDRFVLVIKTIQEFWFTIVKLPIEGN